MSTMIRPAGSRFRNLGNRQLGSGRERLAVLAVLAAVWVLLIVARLIHLQVFQHQTYLQLAEQQQKRRVELSAPRGAILDRNGQPLAMSLAVDSVCINPKRVPELSVASGIFSPILGLDRRELVGKMTEAATRGRGFLWVKRKISPVEAERLRSLGFEWIEFRKESKRNYPKGSLAAHVIGAVDHQERGNAGIEQALDGVLRGRTGRAQLLTDVRQRSILAQIAAEAQPGADVRLTIDERIQHVAERELAKAVEDNACVNGSVVVMNPYNGDILALASYPGFDPNEPIKAETNFESRANHAFSVPFEPGSVFKVITVSAALETTTLRPETIIPCGNGRINLFGRVIRDHHSYSALPMADVLANSSNIGAIQVGLKVGERRLLEYVQRFGFGRMTGLPLPGESAGMVRELKDWGKSSIGSVAMGHEISTTTVQLARACSVIANGGLLVKPRLVMAIRRSDRKDAAEPVEPPQRVIQPETAITMRQMMEGVVLHGTGRRARLDGYTAGGKTGSAQIFDLATKRYTHRYNASFLGFAPVTNPGVVVVVTLNGASKFGGAVAAPVFREVATAALRLLDVPRDLPDAPPSREDEPVEFDDLAIADLGSPAPLLPEPGIPEGHERVELWGPKVPDFYGKTMRAVIEECSEYGLPVEMVGSGVARAQMPVAGSILPRGGRVRIQFAR
jgi:cell division protein FtsI (penicillin-binding protein 3)